MQWLMLIHLLKLEETEETAFHDKFSVEDLFKVQPAKLISRTGKVK